MNKTFVTILNTTLVVGCYIFLGKVIYHTGKLVAQAEIGRNFHKVFTKGEIKMDQED